MRISDWSSDVCSSDLAPDVAADLALDDQWIELGLRIAREHRGGGEVEELGVHGGRREAPGELVVERLAARLRLGTVRARRPQFPLQRRERGLECRPTGRASCRARVCPYV